MARMASQDPVLVPETASRTPIVMTYYTNYHLRYVQHPVPGNCDVTRYHIGGSVAIVP
jgi:hypothetical protein